MSNRPLTATEGALCAALSACLFLLQAEWRGYWHWWALVAVTFFAVTAVAVMLRLVIGEQRLERWRTE